MTSTPLDRREPVDLTDERSMALLAELFMTPGHADPYPLYRQLREAAPVHLTPTAAVAVSWAACEQVLRDRRFSNVPVPPQASSAAGGPGAHWDWSRRWLIYRDPPEHSAVRALFSRVFTPRRIEGLRPYIRELLAYYLEGIRAGAEVEVISQIALPLPIRVIGEMIGIPPEDREQYRTWSQAIFAPIGLPNPPAELVRAAEQATSEVSDYIRALVRRRRQAPADDLISALAGAEPDGAAGAVSEDDLAANLQFLMSAGFETTVFTIGNGVTALIDHPDQLRYVQGHPEAAVSATEEILRYETPIIFPNPRRATSEVVVDGVTIGEGTVVAVLPGAANHDPRHVSDPDTLDLRRPNPQSLSFGSGIHFCLGAALARMEIQEALRALTRLGGLELAEPVEWTASNVFRGPQALRVRIC